MYLVPVFSAGKSASARLSASPLRTASALILGAMLAPWAQDFRSRAGTAEFQYLDNLVFARPAGLAGAYSALAQGVDAVGYNPAGVSRAERSRVVAGTFRYHFLEVASGNATYGFPGATGMEYAFSASYINYGRIDEMDEDGAATGQSMMPASFNPSFTGARKIGESLRVGATLRGMSEYLGDFEGSQVALGWGLDAGLQYQPAVRNLGFGLALVNVGRKETPHYEAGGMDGVLPIALKGGLYYFPLDLPKARVALDVEAPWHDAPRLAGGVEYAWTPAFTVRAGSRIDWNEARYLLLSVTGEEAARLRGGNALKAATGFTFAAEDISVDYAVQYWHGLSWVHALTLKHSVP